MNQNRNKVSFQSIVVDDDRFAAEQNGGMWYEKCPHFESFLEKMAHPLTGTVDLFFHNLCHKETHFLNVFEFFSFSGWKKRYFVLEDGILSYSKKQGKFCKMAINVLSAIVHVHETNPLRFDIDAGIRTIIHK
jgi:hypothetical protein